MSTGLCCGKCGKRPQIPTPNDSPPPQSSGPLTVEDLFGDNQAQLETILSDLFTSIIAEKDENEVAATTD